MVPTSEVGVVGAPDRLPLGIEFDTGGWIPARGALHALTTVPPTLVLAGLVLLRVVKDAWDRNPFSTRTVRRLRLLAATVLLGGCLAEAVEQAATLALDQPIRFGSVGSYLLVSWWMLASLAAAGVINRGHAMRTELDTVI